VTPSSGGGGKKYDQLYIHQPHLLTKEIRRPLRKAFVVIIRRTLKMNYLKLKISYYEDFCVLGNGMLL
jgi:hypothetical protein